MSVIYRAGAEFGHNTSDGNVVAGTVNIDAAVVRSGRYSFRINTQTSNIMFDWTQVDNEWTYHRIPFLLDRLPSATSQKLVTIYQTTLLVGHIEIRKSDGRLIPTANIADASLSSAVVPLKTWNVLELGVRSNGVTVDIICKLNGVEWMNRFYAITQRVNRIRFGNISAGSTVPIWYDDLAGNSGTGGSDNTWPPIDGGILHALPIVDSALGANWLNGAGGALSNAWDILNNLPPQGVSDITAGNDLKQVRNATLSSTQPAAALDLACQSYQEAGLPNGATVSSSRAIAALADSSGTTTGSLDVNLVSNPEQAVTSVVTPAGTAGTYPTNWTIGRGVRTVSPTINISTRPVLRIARTSTTGAARVLACHAAVQFEYAPVPIRNKRQIAAGVWT